MPETYLYLIRKTSLSAVTVTNERKRLVCRNAASRAIVALAQLTELRQKMKSRMQGLNLFTNSRLVDPFCLVFDGRVGAQK